MWVNQVRSVFFSTGLRRFGWTFILSVWWGISGATVLAQVPKSLAGTWIADDGGNRVVLKIETSGKFTFGEKKGNCRIAGDRLFVVLDGKMQLLRLGFGRDWLQLDGHSELGGRIYRRSGTRGELVKPTPIPDAVVFSPDAPRIVAPDGRFSFIAPKGTEATWKERKGYGELVVRFPRSPEVYARVWGWKLGNRETFQAMEKLLKRRLEKLPGSYSDVKPVGKPEWGMLWRWPARSTRISATPKEGEAMAMTGWTALVRARSWAVQVLVLAPKPQAEKAVKMARQLFHDLRIRPGQRDRLLELKLLGDWFAPADGSLFQAGDRFWFGRTGIFRKTTDAGENEGRFQVRGRSLLLYLGDSEKEVQLEVAPKEESGFWVEISGERLLSLDREPLPTEAQEEE